MWFTVLHAGIPVGAVDLAPTGLAAGRLVRVTAYRAISARVRAASEALFAFGFYGPAASAIPDIPRRQARMALRSGAALRLELAPLAPGRATATTFVNLIETPADGQVVVIARFGDDSAPVPAALPSRTSAGDARNDENG